MGIVHHSAYATYFEVARIEALEKVGLPYEGLEKSGLFIPVLSVNARFLSPARFGDTLKIHSRAEKLGKAQLQFIYEVWKDDVKICEGVTTHACMNARGKAIRPPKDLEDKLLQ